MDKTELRDGVIIKESQIHETAFIAPGAHIVGDVILKKDCSVWYNTVARADINQIVIGERSNVQDNSVIHLENDQGVIIGNDVTIGHNAIIHGCTIENGALIGMGAIIMDGVKIAQDCIIAAGALVPEGTIVPSKTLMMGSPAKPKRALTFDELKWIKTSSSNYISYAKDYKKT